MTLSNFDGADHRYLATVGHFTGMPPDPNRLMSPHPHSAIRQGARMECSIGLKDLWVLRKKGNAVIPDSRSGTGESEAAPDAAVEFKSFQTLVNTKRKQTRSE